MNIQLSGELETSIHAIVQSGRFASIDEAMSAAALLLLRDLDIKPVPVPTRPTDPGLGFIGALRDDADLLDRAVAYAMKVREERPWRVPPNE